MNWKFPALYAVLLVVCIIISGIVFGLVVNQASAQIGQNPFPTDNSTDLRSLVSVASSLQILWISIALLILFPIFHGLIRVSDGLARIIFKVIGILVVLSLNIALLVYSIMILVNQNDTNNIVMNKGIYVSLILTTVITLITCSVFGVGVVTRVLL